MDAVIAEHDLPAHTVDLGCKGCISYRPDPLTCYRDFLETNIHLYTASYPWMVNRGVFMTPGDPIAWVPNATWEGLEGGIRVGLQLVFAIWLSTLTTLTTSPLDMVWAMEWYMRPLKYLKVPVDEIALLIMLAIRFIPILFEETDRILKAQKARGVDIESGWIFRKVRSLVPILVPLLHGVFRRADDLAVALTLRGYSPGIERTKMKVMKAHGRDFLSLALAGSVFLALICF